MTTKAKNVPNFFVNAFYESKFRDSIFIVKASGAVIEDDKARDTMLSNIYDLTLLGTKVILIYGGGNMIDKAIEERGVGIKRQEGRRITDKPTLDIIKQIIGGDLALRVYQSMFKNKIEGLNFNAVPFDWMRVVKRPPTTGKNGEKIDWGFVGNIEEIYTRPILRLLRTTHFVACPCLAMSREGDLCNINADTIASDIASALKVDKLIFMSNVDGVKDKDGQTIFSITTSEISGLIDNGIVTDGMKVKLENCARALDAGVKRIHLINGLREDALYNEIYEPIGPGTMLLREDERENYMNEVEVQKLIGRK